MASKKKADVLLQRAAGYLKLAVEQLEEDCSPVNSKHQTTSQYVQSRIVLEQTKRVLRDCQQAWSEVSVIGLEACNLEGDRQYPC